MAYSFVQYTGNGTDTLFNVPFGYISKSHVTVKVDGVSTSFTWNSDTVVSVSPAPANGAVVEVRRTTPVTTAVVDFQDAGTITEARLDENTEQMLYVTQEAFDAADLSIQIASDNTWDAESKRIKNLATPTAATDAATKAYADSTVDTAAVHATNAANSATAAQNSADAAAASYDNFDDRYLGQKAAAPALDNDGNALLVGALYFDTAVNKMRVWSGTAWNDVASSAFPSSMTGAKGKGLRVSSNETAYEHTGLLKRNALINGDFNVWQAGTSWAGLTAGQRVADMAVLSLSAQGTWTVERSTDVPTAAQAGRQLNYSLKMLCTTADAAAPAATDYHGIALRVEGADYAPLYAQPQTISFWVKSNKIGTYAVSVRNDANRSYVKSFTINTADTWERKDITVGSAPADGGTWNFTNGLGAELMISSAVGSSYQAVSDGAWENANKFGLAGTVNLADAVDNYINVADVRLVAGYDASDIYIPSFAEQLSACQRYYETGKDAMWSGNTPAASTAYYVKAEFASVKRVAPTVTATELGLYGFASGTPNITSYTDSVRFNKSSNGTAVNGAYFEYDWIADARL